MISEATTDEHAGHSEGRAAFEFTGSTESSAEPNRRAKASSRGSGLIQERPSE